MDIGVPAERAAGETRVAATPETVKKLVAAKHSVVVESGAGATPVIPTARIPQRARQLEHQPTRSAHRWC